MRHDYKTILNQKSIIQDYYRTWIPESILPLNFRVIKLFGLVPLIIKGHKKWRYRWTNMHRFLNKRRISCSVLPQGIHTYMSKNRVPLRVMQTALQFLEPQRVKSRKNSWSYLIPPSIVPFENDDGLEQSMQQALKTHDFIHSSFPNLETLFVYSGNKSMHLWITNFRWDLYPHNEKVQTHWYKPLIAESLENKARRKLLEELLSYDPSITIDTQTVLDTRRILPVISSLHGMTLRVVRTFTKKQVESYTPTEVMELSSFQAHSSRTVRP